MSYFKQPVITTKATQELTTLLTQKGSLTFTRIVLGSGRHRTGVESKTDVDHSVHVLQANYAPLTAEANTYRILARLDNAQVESELQVNEIGVFAKRNGGAEFLFMYTWAENGDVIPPKSQGSVIRDYEFNTTISKDAQVTVTYESGSHTYAQLSELKQVEDKIEELKSASSESAAVAERLATAREISLSGEASGSANFDGSQNATIEVSVQKASTSRRGIVLLSSSLDSTSETEAVTPKALKSLHDMHKQDARALSDHTSDRTAHVTSEEKRIWNEKANASHGHSISDIAGLGVELTNKASLSHTHSSSDIKDLHQLLSGKANVSHTHTLSQITGLSTQLEAKADKTVVQLHKLTDDNGFAKNATGDWNNYTTAGYYYGSNLANSPENLGASLFVTVTKSVGGIIIQEAKVVGVPTTAKRYYTVGKWGDWIINNHVDIQVYDVILKNGFVKSPGADDQANKVFILWGKVVVMNLHLDCVKKIGPYGSYPNKLNDMIMLPMEARPVSVAEYALAPNGGFHFPDNLVYDRASASHFSYNFTLYDSDGKGHNYKKTYIWGLK